MGARTGRDTLTALELLVEQTHTVWNSGPQWVVSLLSLDMAGAFDNASHPRLLHILHSKGLPATVISWVQSFLTVRQSTITIRKSTSDPFPIRNGIPQGSPVNPILFLFYNNELISKCTDSGLKASAIGFVDDVNIITWGESTEKNCRTLSRLHTECATWAKLHGAAFAPAKYELIHLSRAPKRFNMAADLQIQDHVVSPRPVIRVLGVQIDSKLRWGPQIRFIQAKMARQNLALSRVAASTWGATFPKARQVFSAMIRPAITYGAPIWHSITDIKPRKSQTRRCGSIQNTGLRIVTGAFKATPLQSLEAECTIPPIDLYMDSLHASFQLRLLRSKTQPLIDSACLRIRNQLRGRRGRRKHYKLTPGQTRKRWVLQRFIDHSNETTLAAQYQNPRLHSSPAKWLQEQWQRRWSIYTSTIPRHQRNAAQSKSLVYKPLNHHRSLTKAQSSMATQIRTEKIGFRAFLSSRHVPGITPECDCGWPRQTAKHVILYCPSVTNRTQMLQEAKTTDYIQLTSHPPAIQAVTRWLIQQRLLPQFSLAADLLLNQ